MTAIRSGRYRACRHERARLLAIAFALLLPVAGSGQVIMGRVEADSLPIQYAEVVIADSTGEELHEATDADGMFSFTLPGPGTYQLRARHSSYAPAGPEPVTVEADEEVAVVIRLQTPIPLTPIEVTARRRIARSAASEALDERLAWSEKTGLGRVLRRAEIERMPVSDVRDLLRTTPRIRITAAGPTQHVWFANATGDCMPQVWVDGVRDVSRQGILDLITPFDLEAVEIYRSALEAPPEYTDPGGCGVILLWTRRDTAGGKALNWKRLLAVAGAVGLMIFSLKR
jgi:hypothetical protein